MTVEGFERMLIVFRESRVVDPHEMRSFLEEGFQVFALFRTK